MNAKNIGEVYRILGSSFHVGSKGWINGHCPFSRVTHESGADKHSSFGIVASDDGSTYFCFGCQQKGRLIDLPYKLANVLKSSPSTKLTRLIQLCDIDLSAPPRQNSIPAHAVELLATAYAQLCDLALLPLDLSSVKTEAEYNDLVEPEAATARTSANALLGVLARDLGPYNDAPGLIVGRLRAHFEDCLKVNTEDARRYVCDYLAPLSMRRCPVGDYAGWDNHPF